MTEAITPLLRRGTLAAAAALCLAPPAARAQAFPTRAVRIITPLSPGSAADTIARLTAQKLTQAWGRPVTVENHPGGAGQIAGQMLVNAPPDGHTLMIHSDGHAVSAVLYAARLPYDTLRDMARVCLLVSSPGVLVVAPGTGPRDVAGLIARARVTPGGLTFGSAGVGGGIHFTGEMFKQAAGIEATHVPFRGMPEALTEVAAGRVDFAFSSLQPAAPFLQGGRLVALAVSSAERLAALPAVPTVAESGLPGFSYELWWGAFAPAATPAAIVERIGADMAAAVAAPDMRDRLLDQGIVARGMPPAAFDAFVRAEVRRLSEMTRAAGIRAE